MPVSSVGAGSTVFTRRLAEMRNEMETLSRQLSTGKKAETFAELGRDRAMSLSLHRQQSQITSYQSTITIVGVRLNTLVNALDRLGNLGREAGGAMDPNKFQLLGDGTTADQKTARTYLEELAALMNTDAGGRYIFSGKASDVRPIASTDALIDGEAGKAGLRQVVAERKSADLGADGLGRLALSPVAGDAFTLSETVAGMPFGFQLNAVSANLSNGTVAGPSGSPAAISVALTGQPNAGESVSITMDLPDGSTHTLTLEATTDSPPGEGEFTIGATTTDTANNLRAAMSAGLVRAGESALAAASALAASKEFFATGPAAQAMRVDGPPFDTATSLRPATATDTVTWYRGDNDGSPARSDATARINKSISIAYGMRANEAEFGDLFAGLGAMIASDFSAGTPADSARSSELAKRTRSLMQTTGDKRITAIEMEISGVQRSLENAKDTHKVAESAVKGLIDDVEGADPNEVAVMLLSLQTRMQASYEATAMVYRLSLVNYVS